MKKILVGFLVLMCLAGSRIASASGVPEEVMHDAIMTMTSDDDGGEHWVEGHVILGAEETDGAVTVYAYVYCQNYGFMAGIFTDAGSGFIYPAAFVFEKSANGGFLLREIQKPQDGSHYWPSLQAMMPQACLDLLKENNEEYRSAMQQQMFAQAQTYLDSIGRTENVGDWRELKLELSNILVTASNQTGNFCPPYPLWVTTLERIEDGERFIYTRAWEADGAFGESQSYIMPNGDTLICDGTTGTVTLTKTRFSDSAVIETISIKAEFCDLYVTYVDDFGTKEYHFAFDGETYHQPTITSTGNCQIDYPSFDLHNGVLPK